MREQSDRLQRTPWARDETRDFMNGLLTGLLSSSVLWLVVYVLAG